MKYYDLIVSGSYTPQTVPTGGKALTEKFQPPAPTQPDTVRTQTNLTELQWKECFALLCALHSPCHCVLLYRPKFLGTLAESDGHSYADLSCFSEITNSMPLVLS